MGYDTYSQPDTQRTPDRPSLTRGIYRAVRGAMVAGLKGAAVAAARETLPFVLKLVIGIVAVILLLPFFIFSALPNIFFGFSSSQTNAVKQMNEQAKTIGGAYLSVKEFVKEHVDALATSIASDYESEGNVIDRIEVESDLSEEDILWLIAIYSVDHKQDLDDMSVESVREFCTSNLQVKPNIGILDGGTAMVLNLKVNRLDPELVMSRLGFDKEARTWAGALHETLSESGALEEYRSQFEAYRPSYSGDISWIGDVEYGSEYDNKIDISGFISPSTKNNLDLAAYAIQAWENQWGYVWGTYGNVLTESLLQYKVTQYPEGVGNYKELIEERWLGRRTTDCVGLIKGYGWLDTSDMTIGYAENGMPDYGANRMYQAAVDAGADHGPMSTMPEIVGLAVWKEGHIGVYIGNGYVIEAMSTEKGVVRTAVEDRGWEGWCKIPYITYMEE